MSALHGCVSKEYYARRCERYARGRIYARAVPRYDEAQEVSSEATDAPHAYVRPGRDLVFFPMWRYSQIFINIAGIHKNS